MPRVDLLDPMVQPYAWGSRTVIAELQGRLAPAAGPEAELWMGAHPSGPSGVDRGGVRATLIPKGEFLNGSALESMPQDKQIVLHCKSGARSAEVLAVLKNAGFSDAVHVGGGVLAWVSQVDPALPTY